jgi:hypothetical protein
MPTPSSLRFTARALTVLFSIPLASSSYTTSTSPAPSFFFPKKKNEDEKLTATTPPPTATPPPLHTDSLTGLTFPTETKVGGTLLFLAGTGTRYKFGIAKVYSVGLYLSSKARDSVSASSALDAVQNGTLLPAALTIKLARNVGAKELGQALDVSIAPQVRASAEREHVDAAADLVMLAGLGPRFTAAAGETLPIGTEISFRWLNKFEFHVYVNGNQVANFNNAPSLCRGFFTTYLDSTAPLIPAARTTWIAGIEASSSSSSKRT